MRGWIATLEVEGTPDSQERRRVLDRLSRWTVGIPKGSIRTVSRDRFACSWFSECSTPPEYNQAMSDTAGAVTLQVGPRLQLLGPPAPIEPVSDRIQHLGNRRDLFTRGMETNVIVQYRPDVRAVLIKTDLLNSTFVYATSVDGLRLWSNSSLLLARLTCRKLSPLSMMEFVVEGNVYGQRSLYEDVRVLAPSMWYRFGADGAEESHAYWRVDQVPLDSISMLQARDILMAELDRDFQSMRRVDRKLVLDLTGGYDSRINVGFALRNGLNFRTVVAGDTDADDVRVAAKLSDRLGIEHRCIAPPSGDLAQWRAIIDAALACTDCEYDLIEYAHILNVHQNHYASDEVSMHGSTADLTRHYYFYPLDPYGHLPLEQLIRKKFTPLVDPREFFRAPLSIDWVAHLSDRIAEVDLPSLPAFARLNNIYLRMRMQPWQGRIASSTNRIHSSFTPWTSVPILEAILSTRWRELENRRLTRQLVHDVYPGLDRTEMAGGSIAGVGLGAAIRALPSATRFYTRKVAERLAPYLRSGAPSAPRLRGLREFVAGEIDLLADILHTRIVQATRREHVDPTLSAPVLARLYTLIRAQKLVESWG